MKFLAENIRNNLRSLIHGSDVVYGISEFKRRTGYLPNVIAPKTFNEKILRKKLLNRNPQLKIFADKVDVRDYVKQRVGGEILIPLLGVFETVNDIDFDILPDQFIIKAAHGSGWNLIVKSKADVDREYIEQYFSIALSTDYYWLGREWCYKGLKRRLIIEQLLLLDDELPVDYKFFCFNGVPKFFQVDFDRHKNHTRCLYGIDGVELACEYHYPRYKGKLEMPKNFDDMVGIASKLSSGSDFLRVDLYNVKGDVYFGELTNYPENGMGLFNPRLYDESFGKLWT